MSFGLAPNNEVGPIFEAALAALPETAADL
jgi:hypothetical protein